MSSSFTLADLEKLNRRDNAAVAYQGSVYDVSEFIDKHPGGADKLLLVAGKDVTNFFDIYHDKKTRGLIKTKCKLIGKLEHTPGACTNSNQSFVANDKLYLTLEERVQHYFKSNNLDPKIHVPYFCASITVLFLTVLLWCLAVYLVYMEYSILLSVFIAVLSGFCAALNSLVGSHDLSHFASTHKPWVWNVVGELYSCVHGLSTYVWSYQHVIGHHTHPNHDILDPDVATKEVDFWRIKPFQSWSPHYSCQHIYMPLLFTLLSIKMKIQDFHSLWILKKANISINPPSTEQLFSFFATKSIHVLYRVVIPLFFIPLHTLLLLNLASELVMGAWLGIITQLNHINADLIYNDGKNSLDNMSWTEYQVATTADYATDSLLWNFITGGLNAQVFHHLFPSVLSYHYRNLVPILRKTLTEFGVKYQNYSSFWAIWKSHLTYLKKMGNEAKMK